MGPKDVLEYYLRDDVQHALLTIGKNREVVGVFRNGNFGKRPNIIEYKNDIVAMVKQGAIEFHASLERWSNVMAVGKEGYERFRIGWDLVLDLDCERVEHGKVAAKVLVWALKEHGIKHVSIKFTGGTGFHVAIPWESFPKTVDLKPTKELYPELARKIIEYLKDFMKERLEKALLDKWSVEELAKDSGKALGKIITEDGINPYEVVGIDSVLISPRHLFRMPYSLNRKTFLVSLPLRPNEIEEFEKDKAKPETIKAKEDYLIEYEENEAELLFSEAIDWFASKSVIEKKVEEKKSSMTYKRRVSEKFFPPCIKNIISGLADGRKRSLFILLNFLRSAKWEWDDVEKFIWAWNEKNKPPLRDSYVRGQLRWHRAKKPLPPPNCFSEGWYDSFGVCKPDEICKLIKNPISYPFKAMKRKR
ncbi:MAG TPA: hypothetical protein ENG42_02520 [Candidatus Aenigmarchaeota archaeon]|nr:MAG: hypothetical protein DRP03_03220 [Candidatus Aenigmarchaeota archaeon]HDD46323.1 hypothetical protein [Candidatus Aenigmarchaeota archaeon]